MSVASIALYLLYILLPVLVVYIAYLVITKAFKDMGFSSLEAVVIVFGSFLLGSGLVDYYFGLPFSNIPLFFYQNWQVGVNIGGAVIPILLSIYLIAKNKLPLRKVAVGILFATAITYFVTYPDAENGIVSSFPLWLLPVLLSSLVSIVLMWKTRQQHAAPFAYVSGTLGVLIGADALHLYQLLIVPIESTRRAVIGGANVFDMVFLTGLLAVVLDGLILYRRNKKKKE